MTTEANTTSPATSLRELLEARDGYATVVATIGTNGNGGQAVDISDLLDDELADYTPADFDPGELIEHARDAGWTQTMLGDPADWRAFERAHMDAGYRTGSVTRIYVSLAI